MIDLYEEGRNRLTFLVRPGLSQSLATATWKQAWQGVHGAPSTGLDLIPQLDFTTRCRKVFDNEQKNKVVPLVSVMADLLKGLFGGAKSSVASAVPSGDAGKSKLHVSIDTSLCLLSTTFQAYKMQTLPTLHLRLTRYPSRSHPFRRHSAHRHRQRHSARTLVSRTVPSPNGTMCTRE